MNKLINFALFKKLFFFIVAFNVALSFALFINAYLNPVELFNTLNGFAGFTVYLFSFGLIGGVGSSYIYFTMIKNK